VSEREILHRSSREVQREREREREVQRERERFRERERERERMCAAVAQPGTAKCVAQD